MGDHLRQLRQRDAVTRARIASAGYVHQDPVDDLGIVAELRRQAQGDVEELLAFDHLGECLATDGGLHDSFDVVDIHPMAAQSVRSIWISRLGWPTL